MQLNDISPTLLGAYKLEFSKSNKPKRLTSEKTHASFRLIYLINGKTTVQINGKNHTLSAGSTVYMPPYTRYRFLDNDNDFSLINVFFTVSDNLIDNTKIIYLDNNSVLPNSPITFQVKLLNEYIVNCQPELESAFTKLIKTNAENISSFIEKTSILYVIACLISNKTTKKQTITDEVISFIKNNIEDELSPNVISNKFSYHKNYLSNLVKKKTGVSLGEFIINEKINRAKLFILDGGLSLYEISNRLGFYDYSHFYKTFKQKTGISPTDFTK